MKKKNRPLARAWERERESDELIFACVDWQKEAKGKRLPLFTLAAASAHSQAPGWNNLKSAVEQQQAIQRHAAATLQNASIFVRSFVGTWMSLSL